MEILAHFFLLCYRTSNGALLKAKEREFLKGLCFQKREKKEQKRTKNKFFLKKFKKKLQKNIPLSKEVFYKKYRDNIASMVFNLNGNANDSELLERLIEDEMIEDFSNFKIKQIENLLKNS